MVHKVNSGLMCPWYSLIPGLPTIQFLITCSTCSMPGNVLQAIKNCTVGRPGNKATLSNSYMIGMSWDILVMLS